MSTVLLSQEDIRKVMDLKEVVEITEKTFKGFGEGTTINPSAATSNPIAPTVDWRRERRGATRPKTRPRMPTMMAP